ncbi:amidase signature enzyme [Lentinula edodes]|uniref:Amidase signature enzyme n=1 Tax=Lentinula edodes TaxID=5353 RepID=A0A1Q3EI49_LENED|nr:amidase signature enzyme [Lentinula edodes]
MGRKHRKTQKQKKAAKNRANNANEKETFADGEYRARSQQAREFSDEMYRRLELQRLNCQAWEAYVQEEVDIYTGSGAYNIILKESLGVLATLGVLLVLLFTDEVFIKLFEFQSHPNAIFSVWWTIVGALGTFTGVLKFCHSFLDLYEAGIVELQAALDAGRFTSVDLVTAYLARIEEVNLHGAELRAVLQVSPVALDAAAILDEERQRSGKRGVLHGIPVLLKDNMATLPSEGLGTTAGSHALYNSIVPDDAGVVKRLRNAGAIILGKANMSEFAHFRGPVPSGWSGLGGQCKSAYHPKGSPGGSSSGSGVAASVGLVTVTLGTETDGSITSPSANNNVVGIKPTVGLTSRAGVLPIAAAQDTVGPMTRTVQDAAIVLSVIAGEDPNDRRTLSQPHPVPDYSKALDVNALRGKRIGVPRSSIPSDTIDVQSILSAFDESLRIMESLGATIVDPANLPSAEEIKGLNPALKEVPTGVRTLADLIQFNIDHAELELPEGYSNQGILIDSEATNGRDEAYGKALARNLELGATRGIDAALKEYKLDALVLPARDTTTPAAIAGYPTVTVPLGFFPEDEPVKYDGNIAYPAPDMPFGLSFIGTAFDEYALIGMAYAFEQKTKDISISLLLLYAGRFYLIIMVTVKATSCMPDFTSQEILNGRFHILDFLGAGAYGKVYKALDNYPKSFSSTRYYAIKVLLKADTQSRDYEMQLRELKLQKKVSHHPNIVTFCGAFEENDFVFVVLEYCEGSSSHPMSRF